MTIVIRDFEPSDKRWIVEQHERHYRTVEGFDATFAPLVASIVDDFIENRDGQLEAGWTAMQDHTKCGSIFCVKVDEDTAKLRLFFVSKELRGTGLAQALLDRCLGFARQKGYARLTLWTHESHAAAGAFYRRNGFELFAAKPVHSFGCDLIEQTWQFRF